jgi:hypothetical protein
VDRERTVMSKTRKRTRDFRKYGIRANQLNQNEKVNVAQSKSKSHLKKSRANNKKRQKNREKKERRT